MALWSCPGGVSVTGSANTAFVLPQKPKPFLTVQTFIFTESLYELGRDGSCMGWAIKGGGEIGETQAPGNIGRGLGEQGSSCREL